MRLPKGAAFGGEQGRNPSPNRAQDGAEGGDLFWLYYIDIYMIRVVEKKSRDNRMRVFHLAFLEISTFTIHWQCAPWATYGEHRSMVFECEMTS